MMLIFLLILGYCLGSLSSAIIVCKLFGLPDPRTTGSKNPGATNVLRMAGKGKAAMVLLGDMLKGLLPVLLARLLHVPDFWVGIIGLSAVLGHVFPLFYGFKGGKGVATAFGVYWGISTVLGIISFALWGIVFKLRHYSSLSSLVTVCVVPFLAFFFLSKGYGIALFFITILVVWKHKTNIQRLLKGEEPTFRSKV